MKHFCLTVLALMTLAGALPAAPRPGLESYAGSYTGKSVAVSAGKSVSENQSNLTFTGSKSGPRGTFDYRGILNQGGATVIVDQKFMIANSGQISGRISVGDSTGIGKGTVKIVGKTMAFTLIYQFSNVVPSQIQLKGKVVFKARRATLTAAVVSNDSSYNGNLVVTAFR